MRYLVNILLIFGLVFPAFAYDYEYKELNVYSGQPDCTWKESSIQTLVDEGMWLVDPVEDSYDPTGGLPADPTVGDRYISDATANGWTINYIYEWDGTSWEESIPEEGWMVWLLFDMVLWFFYSGGWAEVGSGTYLSLDGESIDVTNGTFDLTTTGDISVGAATVTSLTDGTATLTGGNLTGLGSLVVDTTTLVANASGYADKVGIGTADPEYPLEIVGTDGVSGSVTGILNVNGGGTSLNMGVYDTGGYAWIQALERGVTTNRNLILQGLDGKVGIATVDPQTTLSILTAANDEGIQIRRNSADADTTVQIGFRHSTTEGTDFTTIQSIRTNDPSVSDTELLFFNRKGGTAASESMRIDGHGNVGIGTASPSEKLDVVGNINIDSGLLYLNTVAGTWEGSIYKDGSRFINFFAPAGTVWQKNTFIGAGAGSSNLDADGTSYKAGGNLGLGDNALDALTTGYDNAAFGTSAGTSLLDGAYNLIIGTNAMGDATTGTWNTAIGTNSMLDSGGYYNTALGRYTLQYIRGQTNVAIGYDTGRFDSFGDDFINGNDNLLLGSEAKVYENGNSNSVIIGIGSNTVVLGNDDIVTTALKGNVGIGTTSPDTELEVIGTGTMTSPTAIVNTNLLTLSGGVTGFSGVNDVGTEFSMDFQACAYNGSAVSIEQGAKISMLKKKSWNEANAGVGIGGHLLFYTQDGTIGTPALEERMRIDYAGNVGIGTTSPGEKLEVNGKILADDKIMFTQTDGNEYIDSLNDGYLDIGATTAIRLLTDTVVTGSVDASTGFKDNGTAGVDGSWVNAEGDTVTVSGGIITAITAP